MITFKIGKNTIAIDEQDQHLLRHDWTVRRFGTDMRVARKYFLGRGAWHLLHREVMGAPDGRIVFFRDGDWCNCTRANLYMVSRSEPTNKRARWMVWFKRTYGAKDLQPVEVVGAVSEDEAIGMATKSAFGTFSTLDKDTGKIAWINPGTEQFADHADRLFLTGRLEVKAWKLPPKEYASGGYKCEVEGL